MPKARVVIRTEKGMIQEILVSPKLIEQIQVVWVDYDVTDSDGSSSIAEDEKGQLAYWSLWDGPDMDLLEDELYEHINRLCL